MILVCATCNCQYHSSKRASKYCSRQCYGSAKKGCRPWNKGKKTNIAPWLGKARSPETIQKIANTKRLAQYSHPAEVREKIAQRLRGKSRGGSANYIASIRGSWRYKEWRNTVFMRDSFSCVHCGATGYVQADHIEPFALLIRKHQIKSVDEALQCEALWKVENGRTLCKPCHKRTPSYSSGTRDFILPQNGFSRAVTKT